MRNSFNTYLSPHKTQIEYGKTQVGRLVIQTEHMQWTYEVRGTHPRYVPPQATAATIDNNVPSTYADRQNMDFEKTNFLTKNMKQVQVSCQFDSFVFGYLSFNS